MPDKILVTYASRTGSTVGVAEAIGKTLTEASLPVDVRPMQEVNDLASYRAVVAGSAIQAKQWLPEALQFMNTHRESLRQKPFAAFLVCMTLAMKNEKWRQAAPVMDWLAPVRVLVPTVSEGFFAGALDMHRVPASVRLQFRLSIMMGIWSEGDHRDWNAIRTWSESLPTRLQ